MSRGEGRNRESKCLSTCMCVYASDGDSDNGREDERDFVC